MAQTLTDFGAPRDILRAFVAASRPGGNAGRRGELSDAIHLMMEAAEVELVTFFHGSEYLAVRRSGPAITLLPAATPLALSLAALLPTCDVPARYQDGAHAATLADERRSDHDDAVAQASQNVLKRHESAFSRLDDEPRIDPIGAFRSINPKMQPLGDADALFAQFMDRLQAGGIDVPDDDDITEAARHAAFVDLFANDAHVRPSLEDLARGFAVPDDEDEDEGLDEALDDLDDDDADPDDTGEFEPITGDDVVVSQREAS